MKHTILVLVLLAFLTFGFAMEKPNAPIARCEEPSDSVAPSEEENWDPSDDPITPTTTTTTPTTTTTTTTSPTTTTTSPTSTTITTPTPSLPLVPVPPSGPQPLPSAASFKPSPSFDRIGLDLTTYILKHVSVVDPKFLRLRRVNKAFKNSIEKYIDSTDKKTNQEAWKKMEDQFKRSLQPLHMALKSGLDAIPKQHMTTELQTFFRDLHVLVRPANSENKISLEEGKALHTALLETVRPTGELTDQDIPNVIKRGIVHSLCTVLPDPSFDILSEHLTLALTKEPHEACLPRTALIRLLYRLEIEALKFMNEIPEPTSSTPEPEPSASKPAAKGKKSFFRKFFPKK